MILKRVYWKRESRCCYLSGFFREGGQGMDPGIERLCPVWPWPGKNWKPPPRNLPVSGNLSHENTSTPSDTDNGITGEKIMSACFHSGAGEESVQKCTLPRVIVSGLLPRPSGLLKYWTLLQLIRVVLRYSHICLKKLHTVFLQQ